MTRKIGIYPGTFDPLHDGHLAFATQALEVCGLDEVMFLPEALPREKPNVSSIQERVAHMNAATKHINDMNVIHLSNDRFTVRDTLPLLREQFSDSELSLFVGSDVVQTFLYRWENLDAILREMPIVIGMRAGHTSNEMATVIDRLEKDYGFAIRYTLIFAPYAGMSSSQIRGASSAV